MIRLQTYNSASDHLYVTCCNCKEKMIWNKASEVGWVADEKGKPFEAYYCPQCLKERESNAQ